MRIEPLCCGVERRPTRKIGSLADPVFDVLVGKESDEAITDGNGTMFMLVLTPIGGRGAHFGLDHTRARLG